MPKRKVVVVVDALQTIEAIPSIDLQPFQSSKTPSGYRGVICRGQRFKAQLKKQGAMK
jgi:hypothetical protein